MSVPGYPIICHSLYSYLLPIAQKLLPSHSFFWYQLDASGTTSVFRLPIVRLSIPQKRLYSDRLIEIYTFPYQFVEIKTKVSWTIDGWRKDVVPMSHFVCASLISFYPTMSFLFLETRSLFWGKLLF